MKTIRDKVAFVTGGASGIGLGIAKVLAHAGAKVVIADLREDHRKTAQQWFDDAGMGPQVTTVAVDVSDRESLAEAAALVKKRFGKLHILVNNAGVDCSGPIKEASFNDWDFAVGVNLMGVANGVQTFLPMLLAHGEGGHIVNTASLAGLTTMPGNFMMYTTTKAAVIAMSESLNAGLEEDNIGVSVLCPGPIKSNIHQAKLNRPKQFKTSEAFDKSADMLAKRQVSDLWMEPETVGELVLNGILNKQLYLITHGEWRAPIEQRFKAILKAMPTDCNPELLDSLRPPTADD